MRGKSSNASDMQKDSDDPPAIDFEPERQSRPVDKIPLPQQEKKKRDSEEKTEPSTETSKGIAEADKAPSPLIALDKLKELPALTRLTDTLKDKGIESASFSEKDGKLVVHITNEKARHVELNEKLGFGTVKSVDIAKEVTYTISKTEKGLKIEDMKGISAQVNILGKDITQQLPGTTIERGSDGKPVETPLSKISAKLGLDSGEMLKFTDMLFDQNLKNFQVKKTGDKALSMELETKAGTKAQVDLKKLSDTTCAVNIKRNDSDHIPINKKEGPVDVRKLDISKNISFNLSDKGQSITLSDIKGVSLDVNILRQRDLPVRSLTIHKDKDGKPESATADIGRPILKNRTKTVTVPLKDN
jgi:hypothetical protein